LGEDVDLTVCKTYVGIRRGKQFAMVKPWKSRVDLGLVLKGVKPAGRLGVAGPIGSERMTHRVAATQIQRRERQPLHNCCGSVSALAFPEAPKLLMIPFPNHL
jgi:hypothetical protein